MNLDLIARRNLELTQTMRTGEKRGSLLWVLDRTRTAMGKRMIKSMIEQPLNNPAIINKRLNAVEELYRDGVLRQAERLKADGTEVDAIIIFAGTNDYNAGIPLGEWYDYAQTETTVKGGGKEVRTRRMPQTNDATFRGRINRVMDYLKTNFPEQQIIILTPIHRAAAQFSNQNIQPEEAFPNKLGLYVDAYVNAVKETAGVWAVPVIDLNSLSGLYPMNDAHARYFHDKDTDRLHPNAEGHRRMALTLMYQLLALPASFR